MSTTRTLLQNFAEIQKSKNHPLQLIYGLNQHREWCGVDAIAEEEFRIDAYNNKVFSNVTYPDIPGTSRELVDKYSPELAQKSAMKLEEEIKKDKEKSSIPDPESGTSTQRILEHQRRLENTTVKKLSIKSHNFPALRPGKKLDIMQRQIRHACKATLLAGIPIHFILTDLHVQHVFDLEFSLKDSKKYYIGKDINSSVYDTYTPTELRYVFKKYSDLKKHVMFYERNDEDEYVECKLEDWINKQSNPAKRAMLTWAEDAKRTPKVDKQILGLLGTIKKQLPVKSNEEEDDEMTSNLQPIVTKTPSTRTLKAGQTFYSNDEDDEMDVDKEVSENAGATAMKISRSSSF